MARRGDSLTLAGARKFWSLLRVCAAAKTSALRQYQLSHALHVPIRVCGWRDCRVRSGFRLPQRGTMGSARSRCAFCYRARRYIREVWKWRKGDVAFRVDETQPENRQEGG